MELSSRSGGSSSTGPERFGRGEGTGRASSDGATSAGERLAAGEEAAGARTAEVIGLGREHCYDRLEAVIEKALALGCGDAEAVRYLLLESSLERNPPGAVDTGALAGYDRPLPTLTDYDCLLSRSGSAGMGAPDGGLREESIRQYCRMLRLPTVGSQFARMAEEAVKQKYRPVRYLEALLAAEIEEWERNAVARRIFEAKMPRVKTLDEFDFAQAPNSSAARLQQLAEGGYIRQAEPVLFIGEPGTGKTHLATGLCVAACRQRRRGAVHDGRGAGERTGGSEAREPVKPSAGPVVTIRADAGVAPPACSLGRCSDERRPTPGRPEGPQRPRTPGGGSGMAAVRGERRKTWPGLPDHTRFVHTFSLLPGLP